MKKFVENTGRSPMYVGNTMIPPGEGKLVDVPDEGAPPAPPAGPSLVELMDDMLKGSLKVLTPQLAELSHEALDLMVERENLREDGPRKGLLDGIAAERLHRADAKLKEAEELAAQQSLQAANDDLLVAQRTVAELPVDADEATRNAAEQAVTDAQVKVTALTPEA